MTEVTYTSKFNDTFKDGTCATRLSCVYLTFYNGTKLPPYYIGSCFVENIIDREYNGSVKSIKYGAIWKQEQKENRHLFHTIILHYFGDREEATEFEAAIQYNENAVKSESFINMSIADKDGCHGMVVTGKDHPNFGGGHLSKDAKRKIGEHSSNRNKGNGNGMFNRNHTAQSKELMSLHQKGKTGAKSTRFDGYYVTPDGEFPSVREANSHFNCASVHNWCKNSSSLLSNRSVTYNPHIFSCSDVGKSFNALGFSFRKI